MNGVISIFSLPHEKENVLQTLTLLKENLENLSEDVALSLDLTYCLSREVISEPEKRLQELEKEFLLGVTPLIQGFKERTVRIEKGTEILGCVSQRRNTYKEFPDMDFYIWLDSDLYFLPETLFYLTEGFRSVRELHPNTPIVVTPQVPKLWDYTWDVLVHPKFRKEKYGYCYEIDPKKVVFISDEVTLEESSIYKFGGGWMTLLSREIMEEIGVPEELGHYGMEDTYIMWRMRERGYKQFILEGVVVAENYKTLPSKKIAKTMKLRDRKDEMLKHAQSGFQKLFKNRE